MTAKIEDKSFCFPNICDDIVPVSQGEELQTEINTLGKEDQFELFIYEGRGHADIATDNQELHDRIQEFLSLL